LVKAVQHVSPVKTAGSFFPAVFFHFFHNLQKSILLLQDNCRKQFVANNPFEIPPKIKTVLLLIVALVVAVAVLIVAATCFGHRLPNIGRK